MAKARAIEGLRRRSRTRPPPRRSSRSGRGRWPTTREDVLDVADIERVHDMRVATRRLRAALEVFEPCFPAEPVRGGARARSRRSPTRSASGATATSRSRRSSGSPTASAAPDRRGRREPDRAHRGRAGRGQRRARGVRRRPAAGGALASGSRELVIEAEAVAASERGVKARRVKKLDPGEPLADNAARIVRVRLDEMRSFAAARARARRYSRDSTTCGSPRSGCATCSRRPSSASAGPAEAARRRARDLQDVLGELHDCDVMLPRVEGTWRTCARPTRQRSAMRAGDADDLDPELAAHAPHRTSYRGLEILVVYLRARRAPAVRSLPALVGRAGAPRAHGSVLDGAMESGWRRPGSVVAPRGARSAPASGSPPRSTRNARPRRGRRRRLPSCRRRGVRLARRSPRIETAVSGRHRPSRGRRPSPGSLLVTWCSRPRRRR